MCAPLGDVRKTLFMHDKEPYPALCAAGSTLTSFAHHFSYLVPVETVRRVSGCKWKDLSIDGLAATYELHVPLRAADFAMDVHKLAIAFFLGAGALALPSFCPVQDSVDCPGVSRSQCHTCQHASQLESPDVA